jgi:prepilin-type N-terminal cleavage/methylation domain-containing protein
MRPRGRGKPERKHMRHAKGGFTLVELMIVVAIIGILAAVAIPKFAQMLEKSREGATKGNLGAIRSAASNYYADQQGQYPKTLDTASWTISTTSATNAFPGFIPQYITVISPVKVTAASTYNGTQANGGPGATNSNDVVFTGTWASPAFAATSAGQGWKYDSSTGSVWVNSALVDMSDNSYTTFGFQ